MKNTGKKLKKNEWSCSDLWDTIKPYNNWTLWKEVEGDQGRNGKHIINLGEKNISL